MKRYHDVCEDTNFANKYDMCGIILEIPLFLTQCIYVINALTLNYRQASSYCPLLSGLAVVISWSMSSQFLTYLFFVSEITEPTSRVESSCRDNFSLMLHCTVSLNYKLLYHYMSQMYTHTLTRNNNLICWLLFLHLFVSTISTILTMSLM